MTNQTIIEELKTLINRKGYIYALCMILIEDFQVDPEKMHEMDIMKRLNVKEASLLLGFLIQNKIDFTTPKSWQELMEMKRKTYELMEKLHKSFMTPFLEKLKKNLEVEHDKKNYRADQKEFFGNGDTLTEAIFYSGTGVYDFQYLEFLETKYKYDQKWLAENRNFDIAKIQKIASKIKNILQEKTKKLDIAGLKEKIPEVVADLKKKKPNEDWDKHIKDMQPMLELYQYSELFPDPASPEDKWQAFYKNLIELFVIKKRDFDSGDNIEAFFNNFSITPKKDLNSQFGTIGNYNLINSHPIIQIDNEKYFIPLPFLLFEAIYESPFYWMIDDKKYKDRAGENRGKVGEEITYEFLSKVFGTNKIYKSVKISTKKGHDDTDIDILCILGSKALCVQVKSKKLTELSRKGDDKALYDDFQGAVQDAYEQGILSRQKILQKGAKFVNDNGDEIKLSEKIDEVYIMVVTTENYPSLTHQAHVMLNKKDDDPFPIVLTMFDLELLVHYLNDPYDFLYYVKQRISLMDYFKADEEIVFLGYHLDQKLWKIPKSDMVAIDTNFGQLIDRNYVPLKAGLKVSDDGDVIKKHWVNENFDKLCKELKALNEAKITDIIFHLLDWSGEARKNLVDFIISTKQKTLDDEKFHNFSMPPDYNYSPHVGVTYLSLNSDDGEELKKRLLTLCQARKYKSKGDVWIGFGSLKNSPNMIDAVTFNNQNWKYNKELDKISKFLLEDNERGQFVRIGKKISRNEKCPCGSRLKYKKCCGLNNNTYV
ncbi:hypothetical protein C0416_04385 [bacterium]|nr:hypothetical protein [bacterium]